MAHGARASFDCSPRPRRVAAYRRRQGIECTRKVQTLSYPEPIYQGDRGETTAWHRPFDADPDIVYANGTTAHYLVTGAISDRLLGIYRWNMGPDSGGPDPHFHRTFSESFYVLLGAILIFDGTGWIDTRPGDYVYVPPGGIHGFGNESGEPASMLILFAPGAPREAYFEGLKHLANLSAEEQEDFIRFHDQYSVAAG